MAKLNARSVNNSYLQNITNSLETKSFTDPNGPFQN
jgi:hypothetical protein